MTPSKAVRFGYLGLGCSLIWGLIAYLRGFQDVLLECLIGGILWIIGILLWSHANDR
jgi:urea transporter